MLVKIKDIVLSKSFLTLAMIIFIIPYIYSIMPIRIDITQQSSLPYKLWITYKDLSIDSDYVLFIPPKTKYTQQDNLQYLKKVICKENDYLQVNSNKEFYCNSKFIGKASDYDFHLNPVDYFKFNGVIPKDKYFVVGTHKLSYDSKYFGFIDKKSILRKAKPIL